jgi:hypothetical protein
LCRAYTFSRLILLSPYRKPQRHVQYSFPKLAAIIANERLVDNVVEYGYARAITNPAFHTCNTTHHIGIKYIGHAHDAEHLIQTLESLCMISTEWEGELY